VKFLISVLFFVTPVIALAHGGGLDASGFHNNRKTGDYHCHRAPSTQKQSVQPPQGTDPTCYVGPRGGTYTITPSGMKTTTVADEISSNLNTLIRAYAHVCASCVF
jgi:hypothetical protein